MKQTTLTCAGQHSKDFWKFSLSRGWCLIHEGWWLFQESDRLFESIKTYRKRWNFQPLDFNQFNIYLERNKNSRFLLALLWDYSQGRWSFGAPFTLVNALVPRKHCCTWETCDLVFSPSDAAEVLKLQSQYTQRKIYWENRQMQLSLKRKINNKIEKKAKNN